ncbi:hypothetical protein R3P38DRAFT_540815 [Favolaschia claudopus]|uniref:F-box domain-containing protein n=1 Tax=Favolaschia claudopus TaxID=2862362 RepID=A0AAW0CGJ9_9AGAR
MASTLVQRLGTNYSPSDSEILQVKNLIAEPLRQLRALEAEIRQLQTTIAKLTAKREMLDAYVHPYQALISPVRRMPGEILAEVFLACLPTDRNCFMASSDVPILLGRICRSWRAISLATPGLWASLHIVAPPLKHKSAAPRLQAVDTWLARSGQMPLSLSLQVGKEEPSAEHGSTYRGDWRAESYQTFLKRLIPFAKRWEHIRFLAHGAMLSIENMSPEDLPMMKSLSLFFADDNHPTWRNYRILHSPRLSSLTTSARQYDPTVPIPWHQLTDLTLGGRSLFSALTGESALQFLSQCRQLRSCKLLIAERDEAQVHPSVELPRLTTLEVEGVNWSLLLDRLSTPQLTQLVVRDCKVSMATFLRSCVHLESLTMDSGKRKKSTFLDNLRAIPPMLRHLTIHDCVHDPDPDDLENWGLSWLDDEVLAILTPAPNSSGAAPLLETFTVTHCSRISDSALEHFIRQRMIQPGACVKPTLRRVCVQFDRHMQTDIQLALEDLSNTGLQVETEYTPSPSFPQWQWRGKASMALRDYDEHGFEGYDFVTIHG